MPQVPELDRDALLGWYRRNRRRSEDLFARIPDESWQDRPIALRNPICFYEGHIPAFGVNTLWKRALGHPPIDPGYEVLFERGIDPEAALPGVPSAWPEREPVRAYGRRADEALEDVLSRALLSSDVNPLLVRSEAVFTVLEHEVMHQETLHYMWRRQPYDRKLPRGGAPVPEPGGSRPPAPEMARVPAGSATLGADREDLRFGWDNEFPKRTVPVSAFDIGVHDVTNAEFLDFVEAGGYRNDVLWQGDARPPGADEDAHPPFWARGERGWEWIGMFERIALPPAWPAWVTQAEASAYARWKGSRLPTEAEYHRAAFSEPSGRERAFPWGDEEPDASRGNFDFHQWEPVAVGSFPAGASAWGIHDLVGNGWEWTSTVFDGFPGFQPMSSYPQYSADFFDGKHYVMKGASPVTGRELVRRSFRNWFRPNYPHVYASFRLVKDGL